MSETASRTERRLAARRPFGADSMLNANILEAGKRTFCVSLIDLSEQGARLRFLDLSSSVAVEVGEACRFDIRLEPRSLTTGPVPCHIAWKMGGEVGVRFQDPLEGMPL